MENQISTLSRPNFFPGQLIDYKDFNRLASQADRVAALMCRTLFEGGGIVVGAQSEFAVSPLKGLSVMVRPGLGLLPNGQPVVLTKDVVIDLLPYRPQKEAKTIVVALRNQVQGRDRFTDQLDSSITGYRTEALEAELVVSTGERAVDGVELFRVTLTPSSEALSLPEPLVEWQRDLPPGALDTRFRARIVPQTYSPLEAQETISLRQSLYAIEAAHGKILRLYLVDDPFYTMQYLVQLHAEILSRPYQPLKVAFLLSEFADKQARCLDRVAKKVGSQRAGFDQETLFNVILELDKLKTKEVLPRPVSLAVLTQIAALLVRFVDFAEKKNNFLGTVADSLEDLRDRHVALDDKLVLAGHLFQRVDRVDVDTLAKYQVKAENEFVRMLSTRFENGDTLSLKGKFIRDGVLTVNLEVPQFDKPLVLVARQYVRRGGSTIHYEMNGKHLLTDQSDGLKGSNCWVNRGLVVPVECLVAQENTLRIRVEKADLDFGFFDVAAYQPVVAEGGQG